MTRPEIYQQLESERVYQDKKWGRAFDAQNTPNDWVAYLAKYVGQAVTLPWDSGVFRLAVLVAAICVAILEQSDYAPRHYDKGERI